MKDKQDPGFYDVNHQSITCWSASNYKPKLEAHQGVPSDFIYHARITNKICSSGKQSNRITQ